MKAVFRSLFSFFLLLSLVLHAAAQQQTIRSINPEKLQKYLHDKDYIYERNLVNTTTIWNRIWAWIIRHLFHPLFKNHSLTVWDIILYTIAFAALVLIVYYFIKSDRVGLFTKKAKETSLGLDFTEEDIHLVDFDKLISDAITKGEYRLAVRYLYLKSLKELSLKGLINWRPDKTNRDYINEMRLKNSGKLFRDMTYLFDYAVYGKADINEGVFTRIKATFEQFNNTLRAAS